MSDTPNLTLPLLAAAQAQKHVTMNEALTRIDALTAPGAVSADVADPPGAAVDGDAYVVAAPATGEWAGRENDFAFRVNGGWDFASPRPGMRVWIADRNAPLVWSGAAWVADLVGPTVLGAHMQARLLVGDEVMAAGPSFQTSLTIPDRAVVIGVSARVTADIAGAGVTGWRVGVAGSTDRYGGGIGLVKDSTANGVTGAPVAYYGDTPLEIGAEGGDFTTGAVRLAVHYLAITPPDAI